VRTVLVSQSNKKQGAPRRRYTQAASTEIEVCFGKQTERGARLEEIGQIGLKPALCPALLATPRNKQQLIFSSNFFRLILYVSGSDHFACKTAFLRLRLGLCVLQSQALSRCSDSDANPSCGRSTVGEGRIFLSF